MLSLLGQVPDLPPGESGGSATLKKPGKEDDLAVEPVVHHRSPFAYLRAACRLKSGHATNPNYSLAERGA